MKETITFNDLGLNEQTLAAVEKKGFKEPSPIQVLAIPRLLTGDANLIAKARTGTGKTAAFGLPLLQNITENKGYVQALVLTPTRELALQVCKELESLSGTNFPRLTAVYGGQAMSGQLKKLRSGVEIVVGTPGRIKDHIDRKSLNLDKIDYFILDEADEMLNMGFIDDIEQIFSRANPSSRILLFSATMPKEILKIASKFMGEYEIIEEEERAEDPILTEQSFWVVYESEKIHALVRLIDMSEDFYGIVFTQTKADADKVAKDLDERGYEAASLHGDIPQAQREKVLARFRSKKTKVVVATDVAARGIDVGGLTHVVNYSLPFDGPTYVHRIGRTGRAGATGRAFTFVRPEERRRISYFSSVTRGNLKEETIPSADEILKIKRDRLCSDILAKIAIYDEIEEKNADSSEESLKKTPTRFFRRLADNICESRDAKEVLAIILEENYKKHIKAEKYGDISAIKQKGSFGGNSNQTRLFVGLGRQDGYNKAEIAQFFTQLLNIPGRLVDGIELSNSFSLVSLPNDVAMQVLELGKTNKNLPHMRVDNKTGQVMGDRRGGGGVARFGSRGGSQRRGGGDGGRRGERYHSGEKQQNSNAGLYRKTERSTKRKPKKSNDM
ncbi:MAG: DEAD/DEAH box helicase [Treponemataceae bacterium]